LPGGQEDHRRVSVSVPVGPGGLDQRLHLVRGEVLAGAQVGVFCRFAATVCKGRLGLGRQQCATWRKRSKLRRPEPKALRILLPAYLVRLRSDLHEQRGDPRRSSAPPVMRNAQHRLRRPGRHRAPIGASCHAWLERPALVTSDGRPNLLSASL
jgi:hypothetical protein